MKTCENCKFWSEMCAQCIGLGPMEAMCLCKDGSQMGRMTTEYNYCSCWAFNQDGAVDTPHYRVGRATK